MGRLARMLSRLKWYGKLLGAFARISLLSQLEYRLNFLAGFCVEVAYMLIKLVYLVVVLRSGVNIGTLTPQAVQVFVGTYIFMTGIWMLLSGINGIPQKVLTGELDLVMTKPGSLQFLQTLGSFNFALAFPNVTAGIALVVTGWSGAGMPVSFAAVAGFLLFVLTGMLLTYSFTLIPALLIFWITSVNGMFAFFAALWDFNNMPMELYNRTARSIGTFVIPIFMITNWAGMFSLGKLSPLETLWGLAVPVVWFLISRLLWVRGIRRYTSANG